jgi:DNA repair exonuclease SbcCD ATPase subunit
MIPLHLLLENFMSHARSELDFTQFDMAIVVGSNDTGDDHISNGVGKSSLLDAIRWVIYGKHRFHIKKRVIKRGRVACSVTFVFRIQDNTYKIVRKMSQRAASSEVSLLVQDGQNWRDLSCDTATATGEKIEELVGLSHDTFVNSVYFQQNELMRFAAATANQKKEILKESLGIEVWDRYQDKAKEIARRFSAQASVLDDRIKSFGDLDRDFSANKAAMGDLGARIAEMRERIAEDARKLEAARAATCGHSASNRLEAIAARAAAIRDRKQAIMAELANYGKLAEKGRLDRATMEERLVEAARQVLMVSGHLGRPQAEAIFRRFVPGRRLPSYAAFCDRLEQDRANLRAQQAKVDDVALKLQQLLALDPGKKCPICLTTIDDLDKVIQQRRKRTRFLENAGRDAQAELAELARAVARQEAIVSKADLAASRLEHMGSALAELDLRIGNLAMWCASLEEEIRALAEEWRSLKDEKARLDAVGMGSEPKLAENLSVSLEKLRNNLLEASTEYGNLQGRARDLERRISERQALVAQRPTIARELDIHNQLAKAFGKGGVPAIIMENVTDDLRNYANEILKRVSDKPMSLDFVTQRKTESGSWTETFDLVVTVDDEANEFDDLSGGEQVRVAMAVRLALSSVLMRRMGSDVKFLLLDEVDQALDRRGVQSLADTLKILSKEFKILVITHNDDMRERFDHIITIQKGPTGSFLRQ